MKIRSQRTPLIVTYYRTLPPLGAIVNKHWYILQSDPNMEEKFNERPVVAYHRCKNLRDMIGSNKISNNKVIKPIKNSGEYKPCLSRCDCQCCEQLNKTKAFSSKTTSKTFDIRHNLNCKSGRVWFTSWTVENADHNMLANQEPPSTSDLKTIGKMSTMYKPPSMWANTFVKPTIFSTETLNSHLSNKSRTKHWSKKTWAKL